MTYKSKSLITYSQRERLQQLSRELVELKNRQNMATAKRHFRKGLEISKQLLEKQREWNKLREEMGIGNA